MMSFNFRIILLVFLIPVLSKRNDAVIIILCRNKDISDIKDSIVSFEDTFNNEHHYPYVFLNDMEWDKDFIKQISEVVSSEATFESVPPEDWRMPDNIDQNKAKTYWQVMKAAHIPYADKESYHNMCRFFSCAFFKQPVVQKYKYYWRIEPGVKFHCMIDYDPFEKMEQNGWKYGFTIALKEYMKTIPSLWKVTQEFEKKFPDLIPKGINRMKFMFDENGNYNGCHFWSNFEIGSFEFLRSPGYVAYSNYLNESGGFYYERWGDAPVHSVAAALFLDKKEVHFFEDIGYTHPPFTHCPKYNKACTCSRYKSIDFKSGSCLPEYLKEMPLEPPL